MSNFARRLGKITSKNGQDKWFAVNVIEDAEEKCIGVMALDADEAKRRLVTATGNKCTVVSVTEDAG